MLLAGTRFDCRQSNIEHRTLGVIAHVEAAAQVAHDAIGNRQPQPEALADRLGGEEGLEYLVQMLTIDTAAAVGDAQPPFVPVAAAIDAQLPNAAALHGVQRIVQQVDQYLLQADRIATDPGVGRYLTANVHGLAADAWAEQLQRLFQHLVQAHAL